MKSKKSVLSEDGECHFVNLSSSGKFDVLSINQEEADAKVILHTHQILNENPSCKVILFSLVNFHFNIQSHVFHIKSIYFNTLDLHITAKYVNVTPIKIQI